MSATIAPALAAAFDYAGVAVFAATGALAAARDRHDIVAFAFFAAVTGIGGGTLRDLILDQPVFWVVDQGHLAVCLATAGFVYLFGPGGPRRETALLWADAVGLAAYAVLGSLKALGVGAPPLVAVAMGVLTACFGGVVRDLLAHQPSVLLRREVYVSAAVVGAVLTVALVGAGLDAAVAAVLAFIAAVFVRAGALLFGWRLPGWRSRDFTDAP